MTEKSGESGRRFEVGAGFDSFINQVRGSFTDDARSRMWRRLVFMAALHYCAGMVMSGSGSFSPESARVKSIIMEANTRLDFRSRLSIQNQ